MSEQSESGSTQGKPGAFATDVCRVEDEPLKVNYHVDSTGGHYTTQCPDCGSWHKAHREELARENALHCCGNYTTGTDRSEGGGDGA